MCLKLILFVLIDLTQPTTKCCESPNYGTAIYEIMVPTALEREGGHYHGEGDKGNI